jgi:hypothetical protein
VSQSISPFTTSAKIPRVMRISGKVRIFVAGRRVALMTPNTRATPRNAVTPPSNVTPGTMRVATQSAAAFTSSRIRNGIARRWF